MTDIQRYKMTQSGGGGVAAIKSADGTWCAWVDVERLLKQLPLLVCEKGHSWLHATDWNYHGCFVCAEQKLQKELQDMTAKAIAAVWLMQEDSNIKDLERLRDEASEVFMGKDKLTIAKLQDELANTREALRKTIQPPRPAGVNQVMGVKPGDSETRDVHYVLMITRVHHAMNGGLEIEVRLP
jgi:hypothetical protein